MKRGSKWFHSLLLLSSFSAPHVHAQVQAPVNLTIALADDGYPTGHGTPEGAAADFLRAYAAHDTNLFLAVCLRPYAGGETRSNYESFLAEAVSAIKLEDDRDTPSAGWPQSLSTLFAARHLSRTGPASYGHASFGFQDVMFVDVGARVVGGDEIVRRTLVVKDEDGMWYVHPLPQVSPLLSAGLHDETVSTEKFVEERDNQRP